MNHAKEMEHLAVLEERCGYTFKDKRLLFKAMCHSSYVNENRMGREDCNERLEFLGDAVLEMVSSDYLYRHYPSRPEGELTKLRASLVCEPTLAMDAAVLDLGSFLLLGRGEESTGGRKRDSVVSDALEALIGAVFLDGGLKEARNFILRFVMNDVEKKELFRDSKTLLQEEIQKDGHPEPVYRILEESGPDHNKSFTAGVYADDRLLGQGSGRTKKAAEQKAAYEALCRLKKEK